MYELTQTQMIKDKFKYWEIKKKRKCLTTYTHKSDHLITNGQVCEPSVLLVHLIA